MEKIISYRCTGKTTELVKLSAKHNIVIVCPNYVMATLAEQIAKDMKLKIPTPVSLDEFNRQRENGYRFKSILIDELGMCAEKIFKENVFAYTLSISQKDEPRNLFDDICDAAIYTNDLGEKFTYTVDGKMTKILPKPPLGLAPHKYWVEERLNNINNAIARYMESNMPIPAEWIEEYNKLTEDINHAT